MEPPCAGLMASAPPDPVQEMGFGLEVSGDQAEQSFDLGDGQSDQARILGWQVLRRGGQDGGGGSGFGLGGGDGADGERGYGQHDVSQQGGVETDLGVVESK